MRSLVVSLTVFLLTGCATNQAKFSLRDPELYVSPNGIHRVEIGRQFYSFRIYLDESLRIIPPNRVEKEDD